MAGAASARVRSGGTADWIGRFPVDYWGAIAVSLVIAVMAQLGRRDSASSSATPRCWPGSRRSRGLRPRGPGVHALVPAHAPPRCRRARSLPAGEGQVETRRAGPPPRPSKPRRWRSGARPRGRGGGDRGRGRSTGVVNRVSICETQSPPTMAMPSGRRSSEPAPMPIASGTAPNSAARVVIRIGRKRSRQALVDRLGRVEPFAPLRLQREVDHHDGVLLHDADAAG